MKALIIAEVVFWKGEEQFYTDPSTNERIDANLFSRERKEIYKKAGFKGALSSSYKNEDTYKFAAFVEAETENEIHAYAKEIKIGGSVCFEKWEVSFQQNLEYLKELGLDIDKLPTINV